MKRKILKLSIVLGLLFQPIATIQANVIEEDNNTEDAIELEIGILESKEVDDLIEQLKNLLSAEQNTQLSLLLDDENINQNFARTLLIHDSKDFEQSKSQYDDYLVNEELTENQKELINDFKELARNSIVLTKFAEEDVVEETEVIEEPSTSEMSLTENVEANKDTVTAKEKVVSKASLDQDTDSVEKVKKESEPELEKSLEIVSTEKVNYRGYLNNESGLIMETPGAELVREVNDLAGAEVRIDGEALVTDESTWLSIQVMGTDISGWIKASDVFEEKVSTVLDVNYRGYLDRSNDTLNTRPWGTRGYQEIHRVGNLQGKEVEVLQEATTQRATWLYIHIRGTNISGWIDQSGINPETISNTKAVNYRGTLARTNDTLNTKPWGTPDYEEIRRVEDLTGREVEVLKEATTQRATWLYVYVRGTDIFGWIDQSGITPEIISNTKTVNYRGTLARANDTLNTKPWGTPGYEEIRRVEDLIGREVEVLKEATTQRATWLYVHIRGTNVTGWIDRAGVKSESITSQKNVDYRGYLARRNDTINTLPWGIPGFKEIRRVNDLNGREVKVTKEAVTQRATWLHVTVLGTNISGWIDNTGITPEQITSQTNVDYEAYVFRSTDTINSQPWGTIGNRTIRRVNDLVNTKVKVTREVKTQRATWAFITVPGTKIAGWIDKSGLRDNILIYLDPGHGGIPRTGGNPGPVYSGVREQDLNLNISLQVRDRLEKLGYQVVMSRENDLNSYHNRWEDDLYARPAHANKLGADLLVSIHHNAHPTSRSVSGIETYIYGENPNYKPLPENKDSHNNPQRLKESRKLADSIHRDLIQNTGAYNRGVRDGAFIVVREAQMPAVLLELGFMSNPTELGKLRTNSYQQKLINGIVTGIHNYFLL